MAELNDYRTLPKYQAMIDKRVSSDRMHAIVKAAQAEIDKLWVRFPTHEETELVVRLVEELGYRVIKTIPLKHALVGLTFTESTSPTRKNWGSVRRKFKTQPLLEVYWSKSWVSNEPDQHPYSGMGHNELHFSARINTRIPVEELRDLLEPYARS